VSSGKYVPHQAYHVIEQLADPVVTHPPSPDWII
jgi:hypothetical protein